MTFQFTRPGRGATTWLRTRGCSLVFQFTHPGKGATSFAGESPPYPQSFNSRTLGRVRPDVLKAVVPATKVSIHAPWEGCDNLDTDYYAAIVEVSIHAPWEGCDDHHNVISCGLIRFNSRTLGRVRRMLNYPLLQSRCFNSRTLGRVRHLTDLDRWLSISFNSRTLGRVRRSASCSGFGFLMFQFTHPGKGATRRCVVRRFQIYRFNSRTLGRVRHDYFLPAIGKLDVSIHAPWEGCDACRGKRAPLAKEVSIHAPWEGCDRRRQLSLSHSEGFNSRTLGRVRQTTATLPLAQRGFQFTHPGKGATSASTARATLPGCFNSRTLGRVRHRCS